MKTHPEQELLSAFVDGELTEREQVTLEAHLASCADCRSVLDALRATLGDLALIPEALPTERDSWALRSAIAKERRLDRRGRRWYLISGSAAAALVAILAFALSQGGAGTGASDRAKSALSGGPQLQTRSTNYTDSSARQVLLSFSSVSASPDGLAGGAIGTGGSMEYYGTAAPMPMASPADHSAQKNAITALAGRTTADSDATNLDRCIGVVRGSSDQTLTPRYYEAARFDGNPAFLLVFEAPKAKRLELWVLLQSDCSVKFWAQARA